MTLLSRATIFASQAHDGQFRKGTELPYIVHPMEVAAIAATITDNEKVLAAAVLHDVIEDCGVTGRELAETFGDRVAELVICETQRSGRSWESRKREAVYRLRDCCRDAKIIALSDKLSNIRAMARDFEREGEAMFMKFHQKDIRWHAWYYRSCVEMLSVELGQTAAWLELRERVTYVFGTGEEAERAAI